MQNLLQQVLYCNYSILVLNFKFGSFIGLRLSCHLLSSSEKEYNDEYIICHESILIILWVRNTLHNNLTAFFLLIQSSSIKYLRSGFQNSALLIISTFYLFNKFISFLKIDQLPPAKCDIISMSSATHALAIIPRHFKKQFHYIERQTRGNSQISNNQHAINIQKANNINHRSHLSYFNIKNKYIICKLFSPIYLLSYLHYIILQVVKWEHLNRSSYRPQIQKLRLFIALDILTKSTSQPMSKYISQNSEQTNQILTKLKQYECNQIFKYRIRQKRVLSYFYQYAPTFIVIKTWNGSEIVLGMLSMSDTYKIKVHSIMAILRKEVNIQQKESIFLYEAGKLLQPHQIVDQHLVKNTNGEKCMIVLHYSKMEISG